MNKDEIIRQSIFPAIMKVKFGSKFKNHFDLTILINLSLLIMLLLFCDSIINYFNSITMKMGLNFLTCSCVEIPKVSCFLSANSKSSFRLAHCNCSVVLSVLVEMPSLLSG